MNGIRYFIIGFLLVALVNETEAGIGQTSGLFLQIAPDARSTAMGETGVAHAQGATIPAWNPGNLGFLVRSSFSASYFKWLPYLADDLYFLNLSYVLPVDGLGTFGLSLPYLSLGEQKNVNAAGEILGSFKSSDIAIYLSYGTLLDEKIGIGANIKLIRTTLSNVDKQAGTSFAIDICIKGKISSRFSIAGAIQNLGPKISFTNSDSADHLSRNLKIGAEFYAIKLESSQFLLAVDLNRLLLHNNGNILNVGMEYWYKGFIALRTGYIYDPEGDIKTPTFGGGLTWQKYCLDFSYTTASTLQNITKFTLAINF